MGLLLFALQNDPTSIFNWAQFGFAAVVVGALFLWFLKPLMQSHMDSIKASNETQRLIATELGELKEQVATHRIQDEAHFRELKSDITELKAKIAQ